MTHQLVRIVARLVHEGSGQPVGGPEYLARLFDDDPVRDDILGECPVTAGRVEIAFDLERAAGGDTPWETMPDLYLVVLKGGVEIHRTCVVADVDFRVTDPVTREHDELTQDLGTIRLPS